jgi:hypothetical protein
MVLPTLSQASNTTAGEEAVDTTIIMRAQAQRQAN